MIILWMNSAMAWDGLEQVQGLFPSAKRTQVAGQEALSPITWRGMRGYIPVQSTSARSMEGGRFLVEFQLDVAKGVEPTPEGLTRAIEGTQPVWTRVLGVVLVEADGTFVSKPDGFPLSKEIMLNCVGDFCETGPQGVLIGAGDSRRYAILKIDGEPESMGSLTPMRVIGDRVEVFEAVSNGSAGGLSGCEHTQEWASLNEVEGKLKASRRRECGGGRVETCAEICRGIGYPLKSTFDDPRVLAP